MKQFFILVVTGAALLLFTNCKKNEESDPNMTTQMVLNLNSISSTFTPTSLASASASSASLQIQSDPCAGVTDFAVCQSNLIREYLVIGKNTVDFMAAISGDLGNVLGVIPDGNSGTSPDGKVSWSKTSAQVWSVLARGAANASVSYISANNGVYTLKADMTNSESDAKDQQIEATVSFIDEANWAVDVYFHNGVCEPTDVGAPSKAHIKITRSNGLWTGKSMLYVPRWNTPDTPKNCASPAGVDEIALYTDFVGNDVSTKAALYLVPATENVASNIANYSLPQFCEGGSPFISHCGGAGEPNDPFLNAYPNNWCTTGAGTNPVWGNNCTSNPIVSGASYSANSNWTTPLGLKNKAVTLPTSL